MPISFVWLYIFKCDVCVLKHIWIKTKRFLFFLFAFGSDLYQPCFSKFFKLILCEKGVFATYFTTKLSCKFGLFFFFSLFSEFSSSHGTPPWNISRDSSFISFSSFGGVSSLGSSYSLIPFQNSSSLSLGSPLEAGMQGSIQMFLTKPQDQTSDSLASQRRHLSFKLSHFLRWLLLFYDDPSSSSTSPLGISWFLSYSFSPLGWRLPATRASKRTTFVLNFF